MLSSSLPGAVWLLALCLPKALAVEISLAQNSLPRKKQEATELPSPRLSGMSDQSPRTWEWSSLHREKDHPRMPLYPHFSSTLSIFKFIQKPGKLKLTVNAHLGSFSDLKLDSTALIKPSYLSI